jgi:MoaA/NifB/PqqE/SkfB family radical SAM enzyme
LHKKIDDFCRRLKVMAPDVEIGISTNGTAFGSDERIERILDAGIDSIVVSLHGGSEETVRKYMGDRFQFAKAVDNVSRFMRAKRARGQKRPLVNLKCVLFKWNDSDAEMDSFRGLAARLAVDAYHFVPTGGPIGTTRFPPGSVEWNKLVESGGSAGGFHEEVMDIDT